MNDDDPYVYPGTDVLRNRLGIRDFGALERAEREAVATRIAQGTTAGDFDLAHLQAIHRHLFQDVYNWAGQVRTVEISKGPSQYMLRRYIDSGMRNVHDRIVAADHFHGLKPGAFAQEAGRVIGDVNHVHPFREGNTRTQLQFLKQLAGRAGHELDLSRLNSERWREAAHEANQARYRPLSDCIAAALVDRRLEPPRENDERQNQLNERLERLGQVQRDRGRDDRER